MLMKIVIYIIVVLFLSACNKDKNQREVIVVDFEKAINSDKEVFLSELTDTLIYLELKTPKDIVISRIGDVIRANDYWIVRSLAGICLFTNDGVFVRQIGRKGQGPGEYLQIRGMDFDSTNNEILLVDSQKILFYDLNGNFLRHIKITNDYFYNIGITDSVLWTASLGLPHEQYQMYAFNKYNDTLSFVPNPYYKMEVKNQDGVYFSHSRFEKEFYRYNGNLYLKNRPNNDTVFCLSGTIRSPHIIFDMGKYKLPLHYEAWFSNIDYEKYASSYWGIPSVIEDDSNIFLLALRRNTISKNPYESNDDDWRYLIYDKGTGCCFSSKDKLKDDILGCQSVWPRFHTGDYYIDTIEWYDLQQNVKADKYPSLSISLEKQFDSFTNGTNELLIIFKRK